MLIGEVAKNTRERIRVSVEEYKGHTFIDLRTYYEASEGEWKPTPKGIVLTQSIIDEVMDLLTQGREAQRRRDNEIR